MSNTDRRKHIHRNPVRLFFSAAPWAASCYMASYLVVGTVLFAVVLAVTLVSAVSSILVVGLPLLVGAAGIVRGSAGIERWRARLVAPAVPAEYRPVLGTGVLAQLRTRWSDPATWRDLGYLLLLYVPLLVLDTVVLVVWLALLGLVTLPLWFWSVPYVWDSGATAHGVPVGYVPNGPHTSFGPDGFGVWVGDLPTALTVAGVSLVLAVLVAPVVTAAARLHARAAHSLLAPAVDPLAEAKQVLVDRGPISFPEGVAFDSRAPRIESVSSGAPEEPEKKGGQGMTVRIAKWSAHHPWRAIVGWIVLVVVCVAGGSFAGTNSATSADYRVGESGRAQEIIASSDLAEPATERILISPRSASPDVSAAKAAAQDVVRRMRTLPVVSAVTGPDRSPDGSTLRVTVKMKGNERESVSKVGALLEQTTATQQQYPDLRIGQTGYASINKGLNAQRSSDLLLAEKITLPVTLVILLVVFGAVVAAGVPVLLALSSIIASFGLSAVVSHLVPDVGVGKAMILLMGMAVGVDYSLFYIKRVREERERGGERISHTAAVEIAAATAGRAIVTSGIAVLVSLAGLYLADDIIFSSLATCSIVVVLIAVISSLTVLPALLAKLGRRLDRPRVPLVWRLTSRRGSGRVWSAMLRPAIHRPVPTLAISSLLMLALAAPALYMNLGTPGKESFSREIPAIQTYDRHVEVFPTERTSHTLAVRAQPRRADEVTGALRQLRTALEADPLYAGNTAITTETSTDGSVHTFEVATTYRASSPEAERSLVRLRDEYVPDALGRLSGVEHAVTGDVATGLDYAEHQAQRLPQVVAFVFALTFVMLLIAFRSVVIALLGIVLNLMSAAAALGSLTVVFQYDWAEGLLGFTSTGFIGSRVPLFLFVILFGLSMDYQIFVVSRIREAALRGKSTREAVYEGITSSAGVVTSAAVVMVSVFTAYIFLHLLEMKQMGFGLAVAILLDAFVIRIMILPSIMVLLKRANWWPSGAVRRAQEASADRDSTARTQQIEPIG